MSIWIIVGTLIYVYTIQYNFIKTLSTWYFFMKMNYIYETQIFINIVLELNMSSLYKLIRAFTILISNKYFKWNISFRLQTKWSLQLMSSLDNDNISQKWLHCSIGLMNLGQKHPDKNPRTKATRTKAPRQ